MTPRDSPVRETTGNVPMIDVVKETRQGLDPKLAAVIDDAEQQPKDYLYCAICSTVITRESARIEVGGAHAHHLTNPHGFQFHVGCFSEALGCALSGQRTPADSWFAGFEWRLASCSECGVHLGWYFDQADTFFYGLILDRLQSA